MQFYFTKAYEILYIMGVNPKMIHAIHKLGLKEIANRVSG